MRKIFFQLYYITLCKELQFIFQFVILLIEKIFIWSAKMREILPKKLKILAKACPSPLYVVGGSVRDCLAGLTPSVADWDICSPMPAETFSKIAQQNGFKVDAVYRNTGTVKISDGEQGYEYSSFRSDKYVRGTHVPVAIFFTEDITLDARRRDFTANAVYYDIDKEIYVDPLQGIPAIKEKRLTTVDNANKVFGEDGLRLMRLARQAAQLGFEPDEACLIGATNNAELIKDISPERIFEELMAILTADQKCGIQDAPYHGLKILDETGVLGHILPELTLGKGLAQRSDYHRYDVLEHSLRAVKYMERENDDPVLRLAALLHDVGKPSCMLRLGNAYGHPEEGEVLATQILHRLKAPKKTLQRVCALVKYHMYDFNCQTSEPKLRRFFVEHYALLDDLLLIKQADFSACKDDLQKAPTRVKWEALLAQMHKEKVPFSLKELAVNGMDILNEHIPAPHVATILNALLLHLACNPKDNEKGKLLRLAVGFHKSLFN